MTITLSLITHPQTPILTDARLAQIHPLIKDTPIEVLAPGIAVQIPHGDISQSDRDMLGGQLRAHFEGEPVDINFLSSPPQVKKLLIADMDSTMIEQECIDELARKAGKFDEICTITERAMNGELDFNAALIERVGMLKGLPEEIIEETFLHNITPTSGASILIRTMRKKGAFTALVSGGFTHFTQRVATRIGFDHQEANKLIVSDGALTGEVGHPILGRAAKAASLQRLCKEHKINISDTIAVGDGANDLDMLEQSSLGVAFHAKPSVAKAAQTCINHGDLTALLYLQGITQKDHILT